jgi:class 3 adenylate cyclase
VAVDYPYHSLEDFLTATNAHVDAQLDDGWGATFPVKGREIEATVLFADIAGFSGRTVDLTPTETLIFVNNFFAWVTAEALRGRPGIVDKYIGDELMVVFSTEFGSSDPFADAIRAAHAMSENDFLAYRPHIGIASGPCVVGYVGTPLRYSASVFGAPVAMAARCAGVKPQTTNYYSTSIVSPASEWEGRDLEDLIVRKTFENRDGSVETDESWVLEEARIVPMKNLPDTTIRELVNYGFRSPTQSATDRARASLKALHANNRYWPDGP